MFRHRAILLLFIVMMYGFAVSIQADENDRISTIKKTTGMLSPSASFRGELSWERVGYFMDNAGDVNADGYEDFLIGTFHNLTNGHDAGATYLILGNKNNIWGLNGLLENADARFLGKDAYDALGYWVSGRGDINGDGIDDMLIGAPAGNEEGGLKPGEAYIIFGNRNPSWGYDFVPEDQADASYIGENPFDHCGQSLSIVGDINHDGYDDFIIGSPYNDDGGLDGGKIHLILGKASGWEHNVNVNNAIASFVAPDSFGLAGYSCAGVGDVNGDGTPDFIIGAPYDREVGLYAGKVYLIFGRPDVNWGANFSLANADVMFLAESYSDRTGWSVARAHDVNADGYADFLIGAWGNNTGGSKAGKGYLILGKPSGWSSKVSLANADASFYGEFNNENAGWSVAGVKDYNGDDYDEILNGAWHNKSAGVDAGKMYLIYGRDSGWQRDVNLATITDYFTGESPGDYAGYCVAGADLNGDGLGDIVTSATYNSEAGTWAGEVYFFLSNRNFYQIEGTVRYYSDDTPVENVELTVTGDAQKTETTDANGEFAFKLDKDLNYTITPAKSTDEDVGELTILAYDAALTAQAAVKIRELTPQQSIAANADCDTGITMYDAMLIAHYVAGLQKPAESCVADWKFDPTYLDYSQLMSDYLNEQFKGIIVGNVNGQWNHERLFKNKNYFDITKNVAFDSLTVGKIFSLPFTVNQPNSHTLSAYAELKYPDQSLKLISINKSSLSQSFQLVKNVSHGKIRCCMFGTEEINTSGEILRVTFEVINPIKEASQIKITNYQLNDNPAQYSTLSLSGVFTANNATSFRLYPNYPNPFSDTGNNGHNGTIGTTIRFEISEPSEVTIDIYNILGQKVRTLVNDTTMRGLNTVHWDGRDVNNNIVPNGIYVVVLQYNGNKQAIRLIKM